MTIRRRAILAPDGRARVIEETLPELGRGRILIRVHATMISSGTHLNGVRDIRLGKAPHLAEPRPLGYQVAGEVVAVGEGVEGYAKGQRVAGFGGGAAHTDLAVVPQNLCAPLPDSVSYEQGSGMNLVLTAIHAIRRAEPELGQYLLVVGLGPVGQFAAQIGRIAGLYVMGWDVIPLRLEIARRASADAVADPAAGPVEPLAREFTGGLGFDQAVMAIGGDGSAAFNQVVSVMKVSADGHTMGNVVLVGGLQVKMGGGAHVGNVDVRGSARSGPGYHDPAWETGKTAYPQVFVRWSTQTNMRLALRLIAERRINVDSLITHRYPLARAGEAVDLLVERPAEALAVVLEPQAG